MYRGSLEVAEELDTARLLAQMQEDAFCALATNPFLSNKDAQVYANLEQAENEADRLYQVAVDCVADGSHVVHTWDWKVGTSKAMLVLAYRLALANGVHPEPVAGL